MRLGVFCCIAYLLMRSLLHCEFKKKQDTIVWSVTSPYVYQVCRGYRDPHKDPHGYRYGDRNSVPTPAHNCLPIFNVLLLDSALGLNMQQSPVITFRHASVVSLHYLVKYSCSKNRHAQGISAAKCRVKLSHSKTVSKYLMK